MNTEQISTYPSQALSDRMSELEELRSLPHSAERRLQISQELAYISFELMSRSSDLHQNAIA